MPKQQRQIPTVELGIHPSFLMQKVLSFMLITLVHFTILVAGLSHPVQASAVSSLDLPDHFPPAENSQYQTLIDWNTFAPLNPWPVYVTAINLMYKLTHKRWSEPMDQDASRIMSVDGRVWIITTDDSRRRQLTTEYAVRALYQVINDMANGTPGFYGAKVNIAVSGLGVGTMVITRLLTSRPATITKSLVMAPSTSRSLDGYHEHPVHRNLTTSSDDPESGEIVDSDDANFRIRYQYNDINVPVQELFFAIFDGIAKTARLDENAPRSHTTAVSANGRFVIHTGGGDDFGMACWQDISKGPFGYW